MSNILVEQFKALIDGEQDFICCASQLTAFLYAELDQVNWVGFYFLKNDELVLGPFQGKVACMRIPFNKGVCGHAASTRKAVIVDDVHAFPGHIACDSASESELVLPFMQNDRLIGVLDLDSPVRSRFSEDDATLCRALLALLPAFA